MEALDGNAIAGEDYVPVSGTLSFRPGEQSKTISVTVRNDGTAGPDAMFSVALFKPSNATLARALGTGTIVDSGRTISINDTTILEPEPGTEADAIFQVSLAVPSSGFGGSSGLPSSQPITVGFATADESAIAGVDYEPASGTLVFQYTVPEQELLVQLTVPRMPSL